MTEKKTREKSRRSAVGSDPLAGLDADRLSSLLATEETDRSDFGAGEARAIRAGGEGKPPEAEEAAPGAEAESRAAPLVPDESERALEVLLRAQEAHPEDVETRILLGRAYARANAYPEAEAALQRALRLEPDNPEARCELGVVLVKKGLYAAAIGELERALELDPGQRRAHYYLGTCHNQLDQLDRAAAAFERAVEVDPGDARAWYQLGVVRDRKGHPDRALEMYRKAREFEGGRG